jgi:hypothetical protein
MILSRRFIRLLTGPLTSVEFGSLLSLEVTGKCEGVMALEVGVGFFR